MKLYKEAGVNPLGCLGPQLIQFPIFIALYQVIRTTLGGTPESVLDLSQRLYHFPMIQDAIPLSSHFLGMDLAANGNYAMVAVVFCGMWLQQRISSSRTSTANSEQQQQMNTMMQWTMPALFSWFVLSTPAGVGLYWASSTIIGIILQWVFVGPGDFTWGSLIPDPVRERLGMRRASHHPAHRRAPARPALTQHPDVTSPGTSGKWGGAPSPPGHRVTHAPAVWQTPNRTTPGRGTASAPGPRRSTRTRGSTSRRTLPVSAARRVRAG